MVTCTFLGRVPKMSNFSGDLHYNAKIKPLYYENIPLLNLLLGKKIKKEKEEGVPPWRGYLEEPGGKILNGEVSTVQLACTTRTRTRTVFKTNFNIVILLFLLTHQFKEQYMIENMLYFRMCFFVENYIKTFLINFASLVKIWQGC